ncbi:EutN/CcmL family microcompartment protein [Fundicoccus culcitae]|uniref:EutN/CcmL family microcompartment protein n=1 Tax=Fundicoccus culcitae TaxID=2969821 RepID=A0ABY5P4B9_9LACT|nr:EutN/CcmL family microcompartment protein [Fundicoccus culcitae]UUX33335.1 EutN/CcmL family microcompartment protein [Fundicoccus culcitae]
MIIGKVVGNLWATRKDEKLNGLKFLVVKKQLNKHAYSDELIIAVDNVGAGIEDEVLITTGSSARISLNRQEVPVDMVIVGIIDKMDYIE